jgi:uncharacterized protein
MKLNLKDIIENPGGELGFDYAPELTDLELNFRCPFVSARFSGVIRNTSGVLELIANLEAMMRFECDRCAKTAEREYFLPINAVIAEALENPEDYETADIYIADGGILDLDALLREQILLDCDMVFLCGDDCCGLCPKCGKDLNDGPCGCAPEIDPRLAGLKSLLDN